MAFRLRPEKGVNEVLKSPNSRASYGMRMILYIFKINDARQIITDRVVLPIFPESHQLGQDDKGPGEDASPGSGGAVLS
jgi:hypothetical protein